MMAPIVKPASSSRPCVISGCDSGDCASAAAAGSQPPTSAPARPATMSAHTNTIASACRVPASTATVQTINGKKLRSSECAPWPMLSAASVAASTLAHAAASTSRRDGTAWTNCVPATHSSPSSSCAPTSTARAPVVI